MSTDTKTTCSLEDLGLVDYAKAYLIQRRYVDELIKGAAGQRILLCEHPPIITLGRNSHDAHILFPKEEILKAGGQILEIDRGGDVTLHIPGQIVVYPILNLEQHGKDLHRYLTDLEQVGIDLLNSFGIMAHRLEGKTGVYIEHKKIMSIGIGVRKWVSYHGLALNVNADLSYFKWIKPCGLDVDVTSIKKVKGADVKMEDVKREMIKSFEKIFRLDIQSTRST